MNSACSFSNFVVVTDIVDPGAPASHQLYFAQPQPHRFQCDIKKRISYGLLYH